MNTVKSTKMFGNSQKTVVYNSKEKRFYLVSSIDNKYGDETMVFECDESGDILDLTELLVTEPNNHEKVLDYLMNSDVVLVHGKIIKI
jgi:hypothetical protein